MNGFLGADTAALREAGRRLVLGADRLDGLTARLASLVDTVPWEGPDADSFRADWSTDARPRLHDRSEGLQRRARELMLHAEEQDACSAPEATGLGGGALGGPGGGTVGGGALGGPAASGPVPGPGVPAPTAAEASAAIGEDALMFDDTGMRLSPPEVQHSVEVGAEHELAPAGADVPFGFDAEGEPLELAPGTVYDVGAHGRYYTDAAGEVVYVEASGGGEEMNPNLREVHPDATYHVNDNAYYRTDEVGRTEHLYVPDVIVDRDMARSTSIQSRIAERWDMAGDGTSEPVEFNAGHVLARQLGGIREEINYTRQWDEVNQARSGKDTIYTVEEMMADGIGEQGHSYSYETLVTWGEEQPAGVGPQHGSEPWEYVPESYDVSILEDGGERTEMRLANTPDGARFPR
ncbi:DNA/RNA non-specific endonuclease [Brachybacterium saurashtrense]|uniref:DNA/RNA non-specific endonuclease n=1 Tax=Brachybacterium saurashtrense TaxID=556288 RepID=A0A345YSR1_9MICO|nr:DNA/RNA non-specific endonuclease [Brachybacterium saurashtrense]AXK46963.1 hypothetical protein DWV08_15930 [Brachybacterium saurashtrense]RRR22678.1 hypothetical protein DXU92_10550 [Brachybacterium saurashtrense]